MAKKRKTLPTSVVIPKELKAIAAQAAADDRRSFSGFVVVAIEEYLAKRGYLPDKTISVRSVRKGRVRS
jgi:hypothetical protein